MLCCTAPMPVPRVCMHPIAYVGVQFGAWVVVRHRAWYESFFILRRLGELEAHSVRRDSLWRTILFFPYA